MCKQRQELEKVCERVGGCRIEKNKTGAGHFLIVSTNPDKPWSVTAPSTPSDWRGIRNLEADLRRRVHVEEDRAPDAAGLSFAHLPLNQVVPDANQPRKNAHQTDLESLTDSILKFGVLEPILVMPIDEKSYRIIAGERRFLAAVQALSRCDNATESGRNLDFTRIPVRIFAPMSDLDLLSLQMTENLSREDMSQVDTGRALMKFIEAGFSREKIARHLGRSSTWVKAMLAQCSPEASNIAARLRLSVDDIGSADMLRLVGWSKDAGKKVILDRLEERRKSGEAYSRTMIDEEYDRHNIAVLFPSLPAERWSIQDLRLLEEFYTHQDAEKNALAAQMLDTGLPLSQVLALQTVQATVENPGQPGQKREGLSGARRKSKSSPTATPDGIPVYFPEEFLEEIMAMDKKTGKAGDWTQEEMLSTFIKMRDSVYQLHDICVEHLGAKPYDRQWRFSKNAENLSTVH